MRSPIRYRGPRVRYKTVTGALAALFVEVVLFFIIMGTLHLLARVWAHRAGKVALSIAAIVGVTMVAFKARAAPIPPELLVVESDSGREHWRGIADSVRGPRAGKVEFDMLWDATDKFSDGTVMRTRRPSAVRRRTE